MKANWRDALVDEIKRVSEITDLNGADVYGAMFLMTKEQSLRKVSKSLWAKSQYEELYRQLLDSDNFYNHTKEDFIDAVHRTRIDRHRSKKNNPEDIEDSTSTEYFSPEEDMESMSDELLRNDDIYYNESMWFDEWKSMNEDLFIF